MIITNCNCSEKLECNCGILSFDSFINPATSVLDVGNMVASGACVIEEYVIDWYRNGELYLVSGVGLDPEIQAFHPFTGEAAVMVESGVFEPKLRYFVVGGVRIFPTAKPCNPFCVVTIDFPTITVNPLYCGLVSATTPSLYFDYRITYNATQDWALAARTARFDLDENNAFFAFSFSASLVPDRLTIWHSDDLLNPIVDMIVGVDDIPSSNYFITPIEIRSNGEVRTVLEMPVHKVGDFLKIRVLPSVKAVNYNTNWSLNFKCLPPANSGEGSFDFCDEWSRFTQANRVWDIDTLSFTWNATACRFELTFTWPTPKISVVPTTEGLHRYGAVISTGSGTVITTADPYVYGRGFSHNVVGTNTSYALTGYSVKANSSGKMYLSKSGNVFTFVFENQADYDDMKYGYEYWDTHVWRTDFVDDNTNIDYYRSWIVNWYASGDLGCGDNETLNQRRIHIKSTFDWDDINKTLTLTAFSVTNGMTDVGGCNTIYSSVNSLVNTINNVISATDFTNQETTCRYKYPFGWAGYMRSSLSNVNINLMEGVSIQGGPNAIPCNIADYVVTSVSIQWLQFYFYVQITATRDANGVWLTDPLENFRVSARIDKNGQYYPSPFPIIYEKQNGVVTTKVYWNDLP